MRGGRVRRKWVSCNGHGAPPPGSVWNLVAEFLGDTWLRDQLGRRGGEQWRQTRAAAAEVEPFAGLKIGTFAHAERGLKRRRGQRDLRHDMRTSHPTHPGD